MPTIKKASRPFSDSFGIVGGGLGIYLLCAIGFNLFVLNKPAENGPMADKKTPAVVAAVAQPGVAAVVEVPVRTPTAPPPAVVIEPPTSQSYAAVNPGVDAAVNPQVEETPAAEAPKKLPKAQTARRQESRPNPYEFRSSW